MFRPELMIAGGNKVIANKSPSVSLRIKKYTKCNYLKIIVIYCNYF